MSQILVSADQLEPAWLNQTLQLRRLLVQGQVAHLALERKYETGPSTVAHFSVRYSPDATGVMPARLFLKIPKPHKYRLGRNEAEFYRKMPDQAHLVPCYDAAFDDATGTAHLLLADQSATHSAGVPLSADRAAAAVDALAAIQARWWDHPDLGRHMGAPPEQGFDYRYSDRYQSNKRRFEQLLELHGPSLSQKVRDLYEIVLAKGPDILLQRPTEGDLTLGHHDLHSGNILFPQDPKEPVYIIDWQNDWAWFGVKDLAFLLVFALEEEQCRQLEKDILRRYCQRLAEAGISGYTWDKAWRDYRLAAVELLYRPLGNRQAPDVLRSVTRCTQAFNALDCMELLE
ncbi:MAG: phosphotransferase [Candidatus Latescibacteria bacterium]|nr:phosphotransferase [Candidatus Latescibacterota bacterium]